MPERVRILCVDRDARVLLLKWRDPVDGHVFWEPPGGGMEPGETSRQAAVRELYEETGLRLGLQDRSVFVDRDYRWAGHHYVHCEEFFRAETEAKPQLTAPTEEEVAAFLEWRYVSVAELAHLDAPLEPPALGAVLSEFDTPPRPSG